MLAELLVGEGGDMRSGVVMREGNDAEGKTRTM
jgi:hypothetical protein